MPDHQSMGNDIMTLVPSSVQHAALRLKLPRLGILTYQSLQLTAVGHIHATIFARGVYEVALPLHP